MARSYKMKTCSISGKKLRANNKNFYVNNSSIDGLHPYSKTMDNMRRTLGVSVDKVKDLVNLINS
tara:strand:+ start:853 stop:1047 length:195 start_codon:yes stop_codon:yes gene_type:complete